MTGDHHVASSRAVAVGKAGATAGHDLAAVVALLRELVEPGNEVSGRREHEGVQAVRVVLGPRVQHRVRHGHDVADVNAAVVEVVAERLRPALP